MGNQPLLIIEDKGQYTGRFQRNLAFCFFGVGWMLFVFI